MVLLNNPNKIYPLNNDRNIRNNRDKYPLPSECLKYISDPKKDFNYVDTQGYKKCMKSCHYTNNTAKLKCIDEGKNHTNCSEPDDCIKKKCIYKHCTNKNSYLNN